MYDHQNGRLSRWLGAFFHIFVNSLKAKKDGESLKNGKKKICKKPKVYNDGLVDLRNVKIDTSLPVKEKKFYKTD